MEKVSSSGTNPVHFTRLTVPASSMARRIIAWLP